MTDDELLALMRRRKAAVRHRATHYGRPLFYVVGRATWRRLERMSAEYGWPAPPLIVWGLHVRCVPGVRVAVIHAG